MLTRNNESAVGQATSARQSGPSTKGARSGIDSGVGQRRLARALRIEWLGQTAASVCWIASVLTYGISSSGDWLQLCAASAWLLANIASIATAEVD